jgi:glucose/arabinose dehydrogenase
MADLTFKTVTTNSLTGILLHPNFQGNRQIYLFYTRKNLVADPRDGCQHDLQIGPRNTVVRYTVDVGNNGDMSIDETSREILLETLPVANKVHNGGDMHFGIDGMLYLTLGDAGFRTEAYSQDLSHLFGKVLRITQNGDIPPSGNPFTGSDSAPCRKGVQLSRGQKCQEIFAYGLRNPFRFTMDPHSTDKVRFLINDVGGKTWEETNVGGADFAGVNYGWPMREGPCSYASTTRCKKSNGHTDPIFWYPHNSEDNGAAVGIAIPPPGTKWPSEYQNPNSFFVAEYNDNIIFHVQPDSTGNGCRTCSPPRSNYKYTSFHRYKSVVSLRFGPYKTNSRALYYTTREAPVTLRRIVYQEGNGDNNAPVAAFVVSKSFVQVGVAVTMDARKSSDPDLDDSLSFEWNFGDQSAVAHETIVSHKYASAGAYEVELTVTDTEGSSATTRSTIMVGSPPTVSITSPIAGTTFAVGQLFTLVGSGVDSKGNILDADSLYWEVQQHHGGHFHPFHSDFGTTTDLAGAPEPEDFTAAGNSYLKVLLTGTDSIGLSATVEIDIMPKLVYIVFDTVPSGLQLSLDEETVFTPYRALSWENHNLQVNAPDQSTYKFEQWSNGASQNDVFKIPTGISGTDTIPTFIAYFETTAAAPAGPVSAPVGPVSAPVGPTPLPVPTTPQQGIPASVIGNNNGIPNALFPLKLCQSDCDNDDECEGDLVCLQRSGDEAIPGCTEYNLPRFFGLDFCVASSAPSLPKAPVVAVVPAPILPRPAPRPRPAPPSEQQSGQAMVFGNNGLPAASFPLKRCQADCDNDNECEGDLVCFQRIANETVPGCFGYEKVHFFGRDFCVEL